MSLLLLFVFAYVMALLLDDSVAGGVGVVAVVGGCFGVVGGVGCTVVGYVVCGCDVGVVIYAVVVVAGGSYVRCVGMC